MAIVATAHADLVREAKALLADDGPVARLSFAKTIRRLGDAKAQTVRHRHHTLAERVERAADDVDPEPRDLAREVANGYATLSR